MTGGSATPQRVHPPAPAAEAQLRTSPPPQPAPPSAEAQLSGAASSGALPPRPARSRPPTAPTAGSAAQPPPRLPATPGTPASAAKAAVVLSGQTLLHAPPPGAQPGGYIGNARVLCGGRCICGPVLDYLFLAVLLLCVPCGLYSAVFALLVRPDLAIAGVALWVLALGSLVITAVSDPGILQRNTTLPEGASELGPPHFLTVTGEGGQPMTWKWCDTCYLYRSPRASHCAVCDNCVECFDHHCPWTGTCIGYGNYRSFCLFLWLTNLAAAAFAVTTVAMWHDESEKRGESVWRTASRQRWLPLALLAYLGAACIGVSGLTLYHFYLIATGQTTREHLKNSYGGTSPWSLGFCGNFSRLLCGSTPEPAADAGPLLRYVRTRAPYLRPMAALAAEQLALHLRPPQ